jgi:serine/threonine-protein kinase
MSRRELGGAPDDGASSDDAGAGTGASAANAGPISYSDHNLPQPGAILAERYRVERELGRGGMAVVYEATQLASGRRVALKWLFEGRSHREERRKRFVREARAAGSIDHPNVVRILDVGEHERGVFIAMELVEGESLRVHLARGPMPPAQAIDLLMPALRGVAAAHDKGVVHRDLKPENIYVSADPNGKPTIKILDFGLSKLVGAAADSLHTLPGMLVGTPQYMSPEQADSKLGSVDGRSDLHTLASILFEALAGRGPFQSQTLAGHLMQVSREDPGELSDVAPSVPRELADIVMWALSRDPTLRPSHVEEWAVELERFSSVPFAEDQSSSQMRMSKPRKPSEHPAARAVERAAKRASDRPGVKRSAPAASLRARAVSERPTASKRNLWLAIGIGVLVLASAALWLRSRTAPSSASAPATPALKAAEPAPTEPAPSEPAPSERAALAPEPEPAQLPPSAPTVAAPPVEPAVATPVEQGEPKRARSSEAPPPASAPVPAPRDEPAPAPRKQSPGVADPWL